MAEQREAGRRRRGRERRNAPETRSAPAPVRPGMPGGAYDPLRPSDVERIHSTALDVLADLGIGSPFPQLLELVVPRGCEHGSDDRLRFPRSLVEDVLAQVPHKIVRHAPNPKYDLEVEGSNVQLSSGGEMVAILDYETQHYRPSRLPDLYDAARLADRLEHVHFYGQPFIATELSQQPRIHDLNTTYAAIAGCEKPLSVGMSVADNVDPIIALLDAFLGEEGAFARRPFVVLGGCPIVSPLRFGQDSAEVMIRCAQLGFNYDIACAPQAGATAPAALAGALVQVFAETLACLVIMNLIRPGSAMSFGAWPFISDLRTGAFSGGGGEFALINAAAAQMCRHYGLVSSIGTGMTDAKTMDAQAGYEKAITTLAVVLAGGNDISTYTGSVGSLIGFSFEGMVIDDDMQGNILRVLRGIEVDDDTLSFRVIEDAVRGPGHFLGHEQTLRLMKTEYLYPDVADRSNPGEWAERGSRTIYERAREKTRAILSQHYPRYIDPARDAVLRERFPIQLSPADMSPGNGRW